MIRFTNTMSGHDAQAIRQAVTKAKDEGARIREQAIHSQLTLGFSLCELAKQSIALGHCDHARKIVQRLRLSAHTIARHVDEPHHIPPSSVPELRAELQHLKDQIAEVEARLRL